MRTLLSLSVLLAATATAATAQTTFRLVDPVLSVDGRRVATAGAPLAQEPFGVLMIGVPGDGTYTVSDRPFVGARRAGQFDEQGLYFAVNGRSVRLLSREPLLSLAGPTSAYVGYVPTQARRARGLARLAVADDVSGRGQRSVAGARPLPPVQTSGPRPQLSTRPGGRVPHDAEVARLRGELDRLVSDRQRLAAERDRLVRERDAARSAQAPYAATWTTQTAASRRAFAALASERDRLAAERARLLTERDQLASAFRRAESERARLATEFGALRARAEEAEARAARSRRSRDDAGRLRAEVAELRSQLQERDRALALLRAEQADRQGRLPSVEAELAGLRRQLAEALAARDAALQQRDDALLARDAAAAESDGLRAERDAQRGSASDGAAFGDRQALLGQLADARAERDRLAAELLALRAGQSAPPSSPSVETETAPTPPPRSDGSATSLPGFDFARLQNPDVIRRRLDEAEYPRWADIGRIEGDVLVLFQTDPTGRVIRTAVPTPLGGGLDGLAEEIVREMRFEPPVVDGQPTGLRSQVLVRFDR